MEIREIRRPSDAAAKFNPLLDPQFADTIQDFLTLYKPEEIEEEPHIQAYLVELLARWGRWHTRGRAPALCFEAACIGGISYLQKTSREPSILTARADRFLARLLAGLVIDEVEPMARGMPGGWNVREKAIGIVADEFLARTVSPTVANSAKKRIKNRKTILKVTPDEHGAGGSAQRNYKGVTPSSNSNSNYETQGLANPPYYAGPPKNIPAPAPYTPTVSAISDFLSSASPSPGRLSRTRQGSVPINYHPNSISRPHFQSHTRQKSDGNSNLQSHQRPGPRDYPARDHPPPSAGSASSGKSYFSDSRFSRAGRKTSLESTDSNSPINSGYQYQGGALPYSGPPPGSYAGPSGGPYAGQPGHYAGPTAYANPPAPYTGPTNNTIGYSRGRAGSIDRRPGYQFDNWQDNSRQGYHRSPPKQGRQIIPPPQSDLMQSGWNSDHYVDQSGSRRQSRLEGRRASDDSGSGNTAAGIFGPSRVRYQRRPSGGGSLERERRSLERERGEKAERLESERGRTDDGNSAPSTRVRYQRRPSGGSEKESYSERRDQDKETNSFLKNVLADCEDFLDDLKFDE